MTTETKWYKVLRRDGSTLTSKTGMRWSQPMGHQPGKWHKVVGDLVQCQNGLHLTCDPFEVGNYDRDLLFLAESRGETKGPFGAELVCREARLLERIEWSTLLNDDREFVAQRLRAAEAKVATEIEAIRARAAHDLETARTLADDAAAECRAARAARDRAVKLEVAKCDSPALSLLRYIWRHEGEGQNRSWRRLNDSMHKALMLAITSQMKFHPSDFATFAEDFSSGYWIGDGEMTYARACGVNHYGGDEPRENASAIQSFEAWKGRKPYIVVNRSNDPTKVRLCVGRRFYWHEALKTEHCVTVTSFDDGKEPHVVACSYKDTGDRERKVERVFKITHEDIKAYHKAIRDFNKEKQRQAEERSLAAAGEPT